jgi:Rrf2 family transcriptional regulator, nitric oxide-sensitive transcriptional repressor
LYSLTTSEKLAMRLTNYTDYSLRTLMYLGLNREHLVTIQDIANTYGISKNHLMKVVHQLGLAGFVETVRGRSGGLRLKKEPQDIILGEVVRQTEPDLLMVECFDRVHNECILAPACGLQGVIQQATNAYFNVLNCVTLADLLRNGSSLRKLTTAPIHFQPPAPSPIAI